MGFTTLVPFDRRLVGAATPGRPRRLYTETEVAALQQEAYRSGQDAAREFAARQLVDLRSDFQTLQNGLLANLTTVDQALQNELRSALPALTLDLARRLIAGFEPAPDVVERLCREALDQLFPERENLELLVGPRDAELLGRADPEWRKRYPGLRVQTDVALAPGDCQVRSRFGLIDARLATKVASLSLGLTGS